MARKRVRFPTSRWTVFPSEHDGKIAKYRRNLAFVLVSKLARDLLNFVCQGPVAGGAAVTDRQVIPNTGVESD